MNRLFLIISFSLILVGVSCVSQKKLTYLQYAGKDIGFGPDQESRPSVTPATYKIMPNDFLFIRVITPDPQWSSLFNLQTGDAGITQESAALSSYPVDVHGDIEIPYVGKVEVAGKTLTEIKSVLDSVFKDFVADAAITVRMVDNYISIIGEVNAPGRYPITKDWMTIFDALAVSGDLSVYSNRQRVQLIRPSPYGPIIKEFSLTDRSVLGTEFYYVMPNDIIYALPNRVRPFEANTSVYTLFLTTISTALVILSYFRTL
jgi:polysaccharide export outer membrane protein